MQTTTLKLVAEVRVALTSCNAKQIYSLSSLSTSLLSILKLKKWSSLKTRSEMHSCQKALHPSCILMAEAGGDRTTTVWIKTRIATATTSLNSKKDKARSAVQFNVLDLQATSQIVLYVAVTSLHTGSGWPSCTAAC